MANENPIYASEKLRLYPNPATNQVVVKSDHSLSKVDILDISGRVVLSSKTLQIDVSFLESGVYFARGISRSGLLFTERLVIVK